jgi:thiamine biosynthesis lipoprotein
MEFDEFRAMNTQVVLAAEGAAAAGAFRSARAFVMESEARFSRFVDSSELARLNRSAGSWFSASVDLFAVVLEARALHAQTEGLFDPGILRNLKRFGYDRSFERIGDPVAPARSESRGGRTMGFGQTEFDETARAIRLPVGVEIDLGGIAKGWIAEAAAQRMASYVDACAVDAGGDLFLLGRPEGGVAWNVGVEDPGEAGRLLTSLQVFSGGVATSSRLRRRWVQGGIERHHVIDPRTGFPAETEWVGVTALAPHAATAEAYAKALLIAGPRHAARLASAAPDLTFLAVDGQGNLWGVPEAEAYLVHGMASV